VKQVLEQVRSGVQDDIDVFHFAKSMANIGAFVAADKDIIDYLKYNLRSQMFKSIAYDSNCRFIETIRVIA
jgi:7-keto-8-aminopelargonate synthetase-like enzyme